MDYTSAEQFDPQQTGPVGVLLSNLGTPDAPTPEALRRYLGEFLADPRVVEAPRWLWWCALNLVILRIRPRRSAASYAKVWTDEGSPLLVIAQQQAAAMQIQLERQWKTPVKVELGMRYGTPSIAVALRRLREAGCQRIVVLPMYPQYSGSTTASTMDAISAEFASWRVIPELRTIRSYAREPAYIEALADSIRAYWSQHGRPDQLLMSFHGIPQRYVSNGDPYEAECLQTAQLLADQLGLEEGQWRATFQSRFGREPWLQPYTDHTLKTLAEQQVGRVDTVCPGFSADCLETLEEMAMENRDVFLQAGGQEFNYISALNADASHIRALAELINNTAQGWVQQSNKTLLQQPVAPQTEVA